MTTQKITSRQGASGGGAAMVIFANLAAVMLLKGTSNGQAAYVQGGTVLGDGGGGNYWWNATSTVTPDGINIVQVTGIATGRWIKILTGASQQAKGAVSGAVSFDVTTFSDFTLSIANDITASFLNVNTPTYVIIEVKHTVAGKKITNLPGVFASDFAWAANINDITVLGGRYNNQQWEWQSSLFIYPTLSAPGSFVATPGNLTSLLNWNAVTNATAYVIDRALDAGFTSGVALGIYTGALLTFTDTGRTNGVQYFYRIRATAVGFNDSAYSTANDTPNFTGFVTWFSLVSSVEQYNTNKGIRTKTGTGAGWGNEAWSNETFSNGQVLTIKFGVIAGGHGMWGINTTRSHDFGGTAGVSYTKVAWQIVSGTLFYDDNHAGAVSTGYTPVTGDLLRMTFTGGNVVGEKSTDGGSTWGALHTFIGVATSFFGAQIYGNINLEGFDEVKLS